MRCSCCENEIKEDERFYEIEDGFYCEDCVEEESITFYSINGGEQHHEDEVGYYRNRDGYINDINVQIRFYQSDLDYYSKRSDEISVRRAEELRRRIQRLEKRKRRALGEDEE